MINHISIKNFAIIENTEIEFEDGLNIITGETGSGKSIVVEAISLALGSRADSTFVRSGKEKAVIQLAGELKGEEIVVTREISSSGKNLCKLNDQIVTLAQLGLICRQLADIHGQYDNQSLLNADHHIELVDNYSPDTIGPVKEAFLAKYDEYKAVNSQLNTLLSLEKDNAQKKDFYQFQIAEITKANLVVGEDEQLANKISILQNSEKIFSNIEEAYLLLAGDEASALSALNLSLKHITDVAQYSTDISGLAEEFNDVYYHLEDIASQMRSIRENITFAPNELDSSISRLDLIENLKKKYSNSIENVLQYKSRIEKELDMIENYDSNKADLEEQCEVLKSQVSDLAAHLTDERKQSAALLEQKINEELKDLNFSDAFISINFEVATDIGSNGNDIVEILISANKGEPLKPLARIASGGEISRIMLAFKNILGTCDSIPTMIFDEIDQGISGITASIVASKLKEISHNHQIICITHLPQIAAAGDYNYRIYKETDSENTYTYVEKLTFDEKVEEIARLLGGANVTNTTIKSARELIQGTVDTEAISN